MNNYQFTPQAVEDLFEIWSFIAGDDLEAANRVEEAVHAACAFLAPTTLNLITMAEWHDLRHHSRH